MKLLVWSKRFPRRTKRIFIYELRAARYLCRSEAHVTGSTTEIASSMARHCQSSKNPVPCRSRQKNITKTDSPTAEDIVLPGQDDNSDDFSYVAEQMAQAVEHDGGKRADDTQVPAVAMDNTNAAFHGYTLPDSTEASPSPFEHQFEAQFEAIMDASPGRMKIAGKFEEAAIRQSPELIPSLSSPTGTNKPFPGPKGGRKPQNKGKRDQDKFQHTRGHSQFPKL